MMRRALTLSLAALTLGACASVPSVNSRFDERTGLTLQWLEEPVVLARAVPRMATAARDYAYLGPLQINRMGAVETYIWIGMASTLDRAAVSEEPPVAASLVLVIDGSPMHLVLEAWSGQTVPPYETTTPIYLSRRVRVAADQIDRIARAGKIQAYLMNSDGVAAAYFLWRGDFGAWSALLDGRNSNGPRAARAQ